MEKHYISSVLYNLIKFSLLSEIRIHFRNSIYKINNYYVNVDPDIAVTNGSGYCSKHYSKEKFWVVYNENMKQSWVSIFLEITNHLYT